jgi:hypothetical protein
VGDADADPSAVVGHVIDPVGDRFLELLVLEIMNVDPSRTPLRSIVRAGILKLPMSSFFLVSTEITRLLGRLELENTSVDVMELRISIRMLTTLIRLHMPCRLNLSCRNNRPTVCEET